MQKTGGIIEWLVPLAFVGTMSWLIWHLPAFVGLATLCISVFKSAD